MRLLRTAKQLVADPIGHFMIGGSLMIWIQRADRVGVVHTAPILDRADQAHFLDAAKLLASTTLAPRFDLIHDVSALTKLDESAFAFLNACLARAGDALSRRVRRLVVIRPHGIAGAAIVGLFQHRVIQRFETRFCTAREDAYAFLEIPTDDCRELDAIPRDGALLLRQLRDHFAANVVDVTLEHVARELGVSSRSLQRVLSDAGTSFRDELTFVRIHLAENRLLASDAKVEAIATELGFGSSAAFIRMFERTTGTSPNEFRQLARAPLGNL